jgi:hypothetical protein
MTTKIFENSNQLAKTKVTAGFLLTIPAYPLEISKCPFHKITSDLKKQLNKDQLLLSKENLSCRKIQRLKD